jgi:hypothetical protein
MKVFYSAKPAAQRLAQFLMVATMMVAVMFSGCSKSDDEPEQPKNDSIPLLVEFTFNFGPDISQHPMTRSTLTELNMTDLWIFDYMGDELKGTTHQTNTDEAFGRPTLSLEYGEHTFYFVASRGGDPVVDTSAKTITWGTVRDTFNASLNLNVQPKSGGNVNVVLNRCVGRLKIAATDVVPDNAAKFSITASTWYFGLNYQTGAATFSKPANIVMNIPSSYIGTQNLNASVYTVSGSEAWNTDVTAAMLASDESVIGSVTIPSVPIQTNHITTYQGGIVGAGRNVNITGDDEWVEDEPVTW